MPLAQSYPGLGITQDQAPSQGIPAPRRRVWDITSGADSGLNMLPGVLVNCCLQRLLHCQAFGDADPPEALVLLH